VVIYWQPIQLFKSAIDNFPEYNSKLLFWNACLYASQGQSEKAFSVLNYALDNGIWWASEILLTEPDFLLLKDEEEFRHILSIMKNIEESDRLESAPKISLCTNNEEKPYIINLHWHSTNIEEYKKYFEDYCRFSQTNMCFIQSSQKIGSHDYCWDDQQLAILEVLEVLEEHNVEVSEFWGTSQGSIIAYQLAVRQKKKCVAMMPALNAEIIEQNSTKGLEIQIVIGDKDPFLKDVKEFYQKILEYGANVLFQEIPGVGHYLPENLEYYLNKQNGKTT
jgi:hypothetical protein